MKEDDNYYAGNPNYQRILGDIRKTRLFQQIKPSQIDQQRLAKFLTDIFSENERREPANRAEGLPKARQHLKSMSDHAQSLLICWAALSRMPTARLLVNRTLGNGGTELENHDAKIIALEDQMVALSELEQLLLRASSIHIDDWGDQIPATSGKSSNPTIDQSVERTITLVNRILCDAVASRRANASMKKKLHDFTSELLALAGHNVTSKRLLNQFPASQFYI